MKQIFKIQKPITKQPIKRKYIQESDDEDMINNTPVYIKYDLTPIPNKIKFLQFLNMKSFSNVFDYDDNVHYVFKNFNLPTYTFPSIYPKLVGFDNIDMKRLLPIHYKECFFNIMRQYKNMQEFNYNKTCSYITLFPLFLDLNVLRYFINSYNQEGRKGCFARFDYVLENFKNNCKKILSLELYKEIEECLKVKEVKESSWGEKYNVYVGLKGTSIVKILNYIGLDMAAWERSNLNPSLFKFKVYSNNNYPLYLCDFRTTHMEVNCRFDLPFFQEYADDIDSIIDEYIPYVNCPNELPPEYSPFTHQFVIKEKKRNRDNHQKEVEYEEPVQSYYEHMKNQGLLDLPHVQHILNIQRDKEWMEYGKDGVNINEEFSMERRFNPPRSKRGRRVPVRPIMRRMRRRLRRNNRKLKRTFRKKIQNINQKLMKIDNKISDKSVLYTKPSEFRLSNAQNLYKTYGKGVYNYLLSLIKPELSVSGKFIAKQPAFINIPTSNVCFKEQINIKIDSMNSFYMFWVPNFLSTEYSLQNHLADVANYDKTYRYYSHLYYTDGGNTFNNWFLHTSYLPKINLSKYRLVSSKCVMQYNGTIMNQQGQFHSCAIYNDLPVFIGRGVSQREEVAMSKTNLVSLMGDDFNLPEFCDIELVRNGLWNKYINITTNSKSLENIALPTDPTDHTFYPMSHYYAKEPPKITESEASAIDTYLSYAKSSDGGHLSYLYTCQNMSESNGYITVIIFYNFEIIPDQSTAPFLRSKKSDEENKIYNIVKNSGVLEKLQEIVSNKPKINIDKETLTSMVKEAILQGMN